MKINNAFILFLTFFLLIGQAFSQDLHNIPLQYDPEYQRENDYPIIDLNVILNNYYDNPEEFSGEKVCLLGFFSDDSTYDVQNGKFALERYFVTCCIYHAKPVMLFINTESENSYKSGQWLKINGETIEVQTKHGKTAGIKAERIEPIEEPAQPFLNYENKTGH